MPSARSGAGFAHPTPEKTGPERGSCAGGCSLPGAGWCSRSCSRRFSRRGPDSSSSEWLRGSSPGFFLTRPDAPDTTARADAERAFLRLGTKPPDAWEVSAVEARLRTLESEAADADARARMKAYRAADRQNLESERSAGADQAAALAERREKLLGAVGSGRDAPRCGTRRHGARPRSVSGRPPRASGSSGRGGGARRDVLEASRRTGRHPRRTRRTGAG